MKKLTLSIILILTMFGSNLYAATPVTTQPSTYYLVEKTPDGKTSIVYKCDTTVQLKDKTDGYSILDILNAIIKQAAKKSYDATKEDEKAVIFKKGGETMEDPLLYGRKDTINNIEKIYDETYSTIFSDKFEDSLAARARILTTKINVMITGLSSELDIQKTDYKYTILTKLVENTKTLILAPKAEWDNKLIEEINSDYKLLKSISK